MAVASNAYMALKTLLGEVEPMHKASNRSRRAAQFSERLKANIEVGRDLLQLAKQLDKQGKKDEATRLLKILDAYLDNNEKLEGVAEEAVLDIPD